MHSFWPTKKVNFKFEKNTKGNAIGIRDRSFDATLVSHKISWKLKAVREYFPLRVWKWRKTFEINQFIMSNFLQNNNNFNNYFIESLVQTKKKFQIWIKNKIDVGLKLWPFIPDSIPSSVPFGYLVRIVTLDSYSSLPLYRMTGHSTLKVFQ